MSFISYAQNLEDVMLWRALKHVENGFYIDVGANDPVIESVTKSFYDRGWHGINIEPIKKHLQDLTLARERDINLLAAAGQQHGQIEVWECEVRGWATASKEVIAMHETNGYSGKYHKVPVFPLKDICAQYVEKEIHFLKIDVEGFEKNVIDGMDFHNYRPWIVIVEATKPNSSEEAHHLWESNLLDNNYQLAYSDGLNRFYLASERSELLINLRYPPNVFDRYIRVEQINSQFKLQEAEAKAQQVNDRATQAEAQAQQASDRATQAEAQAHQSSERAVLAETRALHAEVLAQQFASQLGSLYNKKSWRICIPLPWTLQQFRKLREHGLKFFIKSLAKKVFGKLMPFVMSRPLLKKWSKKIANRLGVADRLKHLALNIPHMEQLVSGEEKQNFSLADLTRLSTHARQVYSDLKAAIDQQRKGSH